MRFTGTLLLVALPTEPAAGGLITAVGQQVFLQVLLDNEGFPTQVEERRTGACSLLDQRLTALIATNTEPILMTAQCFVMVLITAKH